MNIKVTIKKDSPAEKVFKAYMAEKDAFRKAVQSGEAVTYATTKPVKFAQPL